ncbi:hypothetical protein ACS0TY_000619 [Phlomoides rotata]
MHEFSPVDGFAEITENLADMIKFVANEPSVGLFYVQQHTKNATHNIISTKNIIVEKSRETSLHTEDLDDSITMLRSMKECGFPVADEMIKDIKKSLSIISSKQPKRGLKYNSSRGFLGRTSSWSPTTWGRNPQQESESSSGYLSSVFKLTTQRASSFKRPQADSIEESESKNDDYSAALPSTSSSPSVTVPEAENEDLLSDEVGRELQEESQLSKSTSHQQFLSLYENYDEFKADQEAKLEEWLKGTGNQDFAVRKKLEKRALGEEDLVP